MVTIQQGRMKSVKGLFNRLYAFIVNFYFQVNELLSEEERPQIFEALKRYQSYDILYVLILSIIEFKMTIKLASNFVTSTCIHTFYTVIIK